MTGHDLACLVADARRDISDADRCLMLHVEPSVGQLHRRLREVTDALDALSTPPADDVREAAQTFADHVGWNWDALDPMWRERFEQAARKVLVRPRGTVTDADDVREALDVDTEEMARLIAAHQFIRDGRLGSLEPEYVERARPMARMLTAAGYRFKVRPHGTVTDAEVEAALDAYLDGAEPIDWQPGAMREAIKAAREVRS